MERYHYSLICFLILGIVGTFSYPKGKEVNKYEDSYSGNEADPPSGRIERPATGSANETEEQLRNSTTPEARSDNTAQMTKDSWEQQNVEGSTSNQRTFLQEFYTDSGSTQEINDRYANVDGREFVAAARNVPELLRSLIRNNPEIWQERLSNISRLLRDNSTSTANSRGRARNLQNLINYYATAEDPIARRIAANQQEQRGRTTGEDPIARAIAENQREQREGDGAISSALRRIEEQLGGLLGNDEPVEPILRRIEETLRALLRNIEADTANSLRIAGILEIQLESNYEDNLDKLIVAVAKVE